jgi:hypothetical protein
VICAAKLAAALAVSFFAACTALPVQEFASYKDAFAKARAAGEEVLVDHAADRARNAELSAKAKAAQGAKPPSRVTPFDPKQIMLAAQAVDHVAVRFQAWAVIARYNDALTGLAEGKSSQAVAGAFDGLFASLSDFPMDEIQGLATAISPFLAPLKIIVSEAEKERSRQEFLAVVEKGTPLIKDHFIRFLADETPLLRAVKRGLNSLQYEPLVDDVDREAKRCEDLANAHTQSEETRTAIKAVNAALLKLPTDGGASPVQAIVSKPSASATPVTAVAQSVLGECTAAVDAAVARALAKHSELDAYDEVLKAYLTLLGKVSASLTALQQSAEKATRSAPPTRELLGAFITLRQTMLNLRTKE